MSQRIGAPVPNLSGLNKDQYKNPKEDIQQKDRISKANSAKENKQIKKKLDAEYKQSIEGLSIIGTSANNKK